MKSEELIPNLQKALEVEFIQEALFELVEEKHPFAPLLVVNHQDKFLSLSNKDHYLFLIPFNSAEINKEVIEYSKYIFNRKRYLFSLRNIRRFQGLKTIFN